MKKNDYIYNPETFIKLLEEGREYKALIELFSSRRQRLENAEKYIQNSVLAYIDQLPDGDEKNEMYDFIAKTCSGFPSFVLARKIVLSDLTKRQFMEKNSVTCCQFEAAEKLIEKVPSLHKLRVKRMWLKEKINSVKRGKP